MPRPHYIEGKKPPEINSEEGLQIRAVMFRSSA